MTYKLKLIYFFFRYNLPRGIKNLILFFPQVFNFKNWESYSTLELFHRSLVLNRNNAQKNGYHESTDDNIIAMSRCINVLDNTLNDRYLELAEQKLGLRMSNHELEFETISAKPYLSRLVENRTDIEQENDSKIMNLSFELERNEWSELWDIVKGHEGIIGSNLKGWWE